MRPECFPIPRRRMRVPALASACALFLGSSLLGGCVSPVRVDPPAPQVQAPAAFAATAAQPTREEPAGDADLRNWWRGWNDPRLSALIEQALAANPDIRSAQSKLSAARALVTVADSALYPTVSVGAAGAAGRVDWNDTDSWRALLPPYTSALPSATSGNGYAVGASAAWEADVFGGRAADARAARAGAAISEERLHAAQMLLAAELAGNYRQVLALRQRLELLDAATGSTADLDRYVRARFSAGQATTADVSAVRARLAEQQSQREALAAQIDIRLRRIAVLCGLPPEQLPVMAATPSPVPAAPVGQLPSSVLDRRPDVRAAQAAVQARAAQLERSKADLLPSFAIVFLGGEGHLDFSGVPDASGLGGLLGLRVSLPLFNAGRLHAYVSASDARLEAAVADYDRTVLAALEDVENAYALRSALDLRVARLESARDAAWRASRSKSALFDAGQAIRSEVLQSRLELSRIDDVLAQARMEQAIAAIRLYQALGGGW